jgi:restriction endonuclease S subunit
MKTMDMQLDIKKLDKSSWKTYRFDQIASMVSERVDPNTTDLDIYVGLEHLDQESIHIKRTGSPSDVSGQKLKCYPGDVIFGKRRAYQRKAAIVDFEGICSAHAFVLRAKPKVMDPKFFPFFLHSDAFMHRAIDISVGGLSPTINWKNLREQEFLLPPKEEQAALAELLWAMDEVVEREIAVSNQLNLFFHCWLNTEINTRNDWVRKPLNSVANIQTGVAKNKNLAGESDVIEVPYLRVANVQDGYLDLNEIKKIFIRKRDRARFSLMHGDLLLTEGGDFDKLGRGYLWNNEIADCVHQNHVFAIRANPKFLLPMFLSLVARSNYGKQYFLACAKKTSNLASINSSQLKEFRIFVPELSEQHKLVDQYLATEASMNQVKAQIAASKALQKSLINQIF